MTVLAFMQNMWVRDPERVRSYIERHGDAYRRRAIRQFLFAGCLTGRRLATAFSEERCRQIIWEESTRQIAGDPRTVFPADLEHIKAAIAEHKPDIVLTFGRVAGDAVPRVWNGPIVRAMHPAARQGAVASLNRASQLLHQMLERLA